MILNHQYDNGADGLRGNDDCGQMSAWYLFSSLGFYPVSPSSDEYWIGSPLVHEALINLENGKIFMVESVNLGEKNVYVQKILLNGKPLSGLRLKHSDIVKGGEMQFFITDK